MMIFRDTVRITKNRKEPDWHDVPALIERTGALRRGGYYDALAGDARAYLPSDDQFLLSVGYDIEGYYLESTKYGVTKTYRIILAAVGERHVTTGEVSHVEVDLEEVK